MYDWNRILVAGASILSYFYINFEYIYSSLFYFYFLHFTSWCLVFHYTYWKTLSGHVVNIMQQEVSYTQVESHSRGYRNTASVANEELNAMTMGKKIASSQSGI